MFSNIIVYSAYYLPTVCPCIYVWCVARSRSHSRRAIIDEAGGGSYPIRVHALAGAHFVAVQHMLGGRGDKRRGAPRTSITESDTEIKRETIYVYT